MKVYPIKFNPILKEKIWGGNRLKTILSKETDMLSIGESWEISDVNDNISEVRNGIYNGTNLKTLIEEHAVSFLGAHNFEQFGYNFPLLIKFLDAKTDLSVQVHPDNAMAKVYHNSFGKTEMWYVMDSDDDANIVIGLKDETTNTKILNHISKENVDKIFNRESVKKGDSFFIPAGKIHAIGAGVLAAEIQQTSDVTYRVYDWDRMDDDGNKRELHTNLAEKATKSFSSNGKVDYKLDVNKSAPLVKCDYFTTNIINVQNIYNKDYSNLDSFIIFMCVEGDIVIEADGEKESIKMGETVLIPAQTEQVIFRSQNAKLLEVYIDSKCG